MVHGTSRKEQRVFMYLLLVAVVAEDLEDEVPLLRPD
jgi:hypothetical protein